MSEHRILSNREIFSDRNLKLIFAVTLAGTMGVSLITPVLPKIVDAFSITKSQVSWVLIVYTLPGLLASPFHGILSDKWGRKSVLVPLLFLFGIAGFLSGFAVNFWQLLLFRFLQGLGGSGLFTLNNAIIGDIYRGKTRMQVMGINSAMISIGTAVFPAIGGFLGGLHWRFPFYLALYAAAVGILILWKMDDLNIHTNESVSNYLRKTLFVVRQWKIIRLYILSFITFFITFGAMIAYLPLYMSERFGSSPFSIGLVISCGSLSSALLSANLSRIERVIPVRYMVALAFVLYTVVFGWLTQTNTAWHLMLTSTLFGAGQGLNIPSVQTLIVSLAPVEVRGMFMAFNSMVVLMGITLGPVAASLVFKHWGMIQIYYSAGFLTLVFVLVLFVGGRDLKI